MKSDVFSSFINPGEIFEYPKLSKKEEDDILAGFFEQLLIFDRVIISTTRINFSLTFLLAKLGIKTVERLIDSGYIKFILWTPIIFSGSGRQLEDNTIDESVIYGQTPIVAGTLAPEDYDPENNVQNALANFHMVRRTRREITRKISKHYIIPEGMIFSTDSAKLVLDAYKNNDLAVLGLPFEKAPEHLDLQQRGKLLDLSSKVLETAVLSKYGLKSYENYEHLTICKKNIENIGRAYNISENSTTLFRLENLPDLKQLFLENQLDFDSAFKLRHLSTAKFYRKWINEIGETANAQEITTEYLNEIKGTYKFVDSTKGKVVKNLASFAVNAAIGAAIGGPIGTVAGLGLGMLESLWIDSLLKGKRPSMFIEDVKARIRQEE